MKANQYPHVTVATTVFQNDTFLMVKESSNGEVVFNQPAGHLELGETLLQAAVRETLEETAWQVKLTGYLGVSQFVAPANGVTYIRHSFVAEPLEHYTDRKLDDDIIEACWLSLPEIKQAALRSPLVLNDIQRFMAGKVYDLDLFTMAD